MSVNYLEILGVAATAPAYHDKRFAEPGVTAGIWVDDSGFAASGAAIGHAEVEMGQFVRHEWSIAQKLLVSMGEMELA